MPHLTHHGRRHSWPYCGSGTRFRERPNLPIITLTVPPEELESQFLAPVVSEDLLRDDAEAAGIVRSQPARSHHRLWPSSKEVVGHGQPRTGPASLRRMIQPPLDRARSLFVLPTPAPFGETMLIPYWIHRLSAHPIPSRERGRRDGDERGRLMVERNHRRCHSERPRSWKQPSANLWTLHEE